MTTSGTGRALSFDELVVSTERRLLRLGLMLTGGVHSAEDLVQTVFARAHRKWDRIKALDNPEAYLRTMVLNEFLSWRRLLKNGELPVAEPADLPSTEDIAVVLGCAPATVRSNAARGLATLRNNLPAEEER